MAFAEINGHTLHYKWVDQGKDQTIVFLNSLGTDFRIWDEVIPEFIEIGNVLLSDKRGHGLSDVVEETSSLKDYAKDTIKLLNHLKIGEFILIGLSVGGMIAMELTQLIPNKIKKLILCDTRHQIGSEEGWNQRIQTVQAEGMSAVSTGVMEIWFSKKFRQSNPEAVRGYQNMLERIPVQGYVQTCKAIRDADLIDVCKQISVPTLCITGSEDTSTPPEDVKDLAVLISGSTFEVIEGSAHIPCVDNATLFTQLVKEFLAKN